MDKTVHLKISFSEQILQEIQKKLLQLVREKNADFASDILKKNENSLTEIFRNKNINFKLYTLQRSSETITNLAPCPLLALNLLL